MTLNTSAVSDAVVSELAAIVQHSAASADMHGDSRHVTPSTQPQAEARLRDATASVLRGTQELFPGGVSIEAVDDPEISGSRYLMVSCRSNRSIEEIMVAFNQWHGKLMLWAPGMGHLFRLSIDAIE